MIGAVAHQMRERILDQFEHLAIELGLGAVHFKLDGLAEFGSKIAHDAGQFLPRIADRLHARLHHAFLQLGGDIREPLQRHFEVGILVPAHDFEKLIAGQHQLRHRRHQMIQRIDADADRMIGELVGRFGAGFSGARRASRRLRSPAVAPLALGRRGAVAGFGTGSRRRRAVVRLFAPRHAAKPVDEIGVVALGLALQSFDPVEDRLDAVERRENERHGVGGDRHAVAELAHQRFGGVRQPFEPRQSEEAAGAFDGVNEAKNIAEDLAVVRVLLETHEFGVDAIQTLAGLGQEIPQQLVHTTRLVASGASPRRRIHNVFHSNLRARRARSSPGATA